MKRLTMLSFILAALVTPAQAQNQAPAGNAASNQAQVQGFNGLVFDRGTPGPAYQGSPSGYQANQALAYQPRHPARRMRAPQ